MIRGIKSLFSGKKLEKHRFLSIMKAKMALNNVNVNVRDRKKLSES